jgi:hypothetical protein
MTDITDLMDDPRFLNRVGNVLDASSALMGGMSHQQYGEQQQAAALFQAAQLRQNAGQAQAGAQRAAWDADIQAKYIASTAIANAAASGGGASDPTVVNLIARNASEGAYRKAIALYQGDDRARAMNLSADAKEYEGAMAKDNSNSEANLSAFKAASTLMKGYTKDASLLQRFGGDGPGVK